MGFKADVTYDMDDAPFKARMYFLFSGDKEYQITFQSAEDRWSELEPKFQEVIDSFTISSSGSAE